MVSNIKIWGLKQVTEGSEFHSKESAKSSFCITEFSCTFILRNIMRDVKTSAQTFNVFLMFFKVSMPSQISIVFSLTFRLSSERSLLKYLMSIFFSWSLL